MRRTADEIRSRLPVRDVTRTSRSLRNDTCEKTCLSAIRQQSCVFRFGDKQNAYNASIVSKMQTSIGVRVDDEHLEVILQLAEKEHRTPAATMRLLTLEALAGRGLWPPQKSATKARRRT